MATHPQLLPARDAPSRFNALLRGTRTHLGRPLPRAAYPNARNMPPPAAATKWCCPDDAFRGNLSCCPRIVHRHLWAARTAHVATAHPSVHALSPLGSRRALCGF